MEKLIFKTDFLKNKKKLKNNSLGLNKKSGRNSLGKITVNHKGGGRKKLFKKIDFLKNQNNYKIGILEKAEYCANRNSFVNRFFDFQKKKHFYDIAGSNKTGVLLKKGSIIKISKDSPLKLNNKLRLSEIPTGTIIYNLNNNKERICSSSGCFCVILQKTSKTCKIKLPSNKIKKISINNFASIGRVGNIFHKFRKLKKAGESRWLGIRPSVRGVAMNPIDHPNGGGEGKSVGKLSP
jgi:large subunit ribosomal protein L2